MSKHTPVRGFSSLANKTAPAATAAVLNTQNKIQKGQEIVNTRTRTAPVSQVQNIVDVPITDANGMIVGYRRITASEQYQGMAARPSVGVEHGNFAAPRGKKDFPRYQRNLLDPKHYAFHDLFFVPFKTVLADDLFRGCDSRHTPVDGEDFFLSADTAEFVGNYARMMVAYVRMHNDANMASANPDENFNTFTRVVISKVSKLLKQTAYENGRHRGNEFKGEDVTFGFIYGISHTQDESGLSKHPANGGSSWEEVFTNFLGDVGMLSTDGGFRTYDEVVKLATPSDNQKLYIWMYERYQDISAALKAQREERNGGNVHHDDDMDDDAGNR